MARKNINLLTIIDGFPDQNILVLGDAMLDNYLRGTSQRLCQEAPVPVVDIHEVISVPGGAANTAVNLHSLGAQVAFLSVIGQDYEGSMLLKSMEEAQVSTEHILTAPHRKTLAKQRILASSQVLIRFDQGSTFPLDEELESKLIERLTALFHASQAVVISDYTYGVMTPRVALHNWCVILLRCS